MPVIPAIVTAPVIPLTELTIDSAVVPPIIRFASNLKSPLMVIPVIVLARSTTISPLSYEFPVLPTVVTILSDPAEAP